MTNFSALLSDVVTSIDKLRTELKGDNPVTLDELAPKLVALTDALPALPPDEGRALIEDLIALNLALGELAQNFEQRRKSTQDALSLISTRLRASTAYAKSAAAAGQADHSK